VRTAVDWLLDFLLGRQSVQLGLVRSSAVPLGVPPLETSTPGSGSAGPSDAGDGSGTGS
jgi:NADH dehydrogenase